MRGNTVTLHLTYGRVAQTGNLWQFDYGQRLILAGVALPSAYEVHFNNAETGNSKTVIGDSTGVDIPDEYLLTGDKIHVWVYLHDGESDGETEYHGIINVSKRARPTDQEPTPVQQSEIDQAIAALNAGISTVEEIAEGIPQTIDDALADAKASGEFDGEPGQPGAPGAPGVSPSVSVDTITGGHEVTITDASGDHSFNVMDGAKGDPGTPGDPTELIDDTSTTATDKVWSAKKSYGECSDLYSAINQKQDAPTVAGTSGQVLGLNNNLDPVWLTPSGGGGIIDDELSTSSTNPVQNKVIAKAVNGIKETAVKNVAFVLSDYLYKKDTYLDANFTEKTLVGYDLYKIPCQNLDFISMQWTGDSPFQSLNSNYYYTIETANGYERGLTDKNWFYYVSGKQSMFIAPANALAVYFCFRDASVSGLTIYKNTPRAYLSNGDSSNYFIIPVNQETCVNAACYLGATTGNINIWSNSDYKVWWFKVKKGDTIRFREPLEALNYLARCVDTDGTITTITAMTHTFTSDAIGFAFEKSIQPDNIEIIPYGAKLKIDFSNVVNSPIETPYNGLSAVSFGTSLTYRAQTTGGYLQYLPDMSGITFDNQGVGSSYIYWTADQEYSMLAKIKSYDSYVNKDICTIEGFVNDWYHGRTLGSWDDNTETSVCGCLRSALNYVLSQNANITIFLILDPYGRDYDNVDCSSTAKNPSNITQYEFYETVAKVAESMGIPVIKMYAESQINESTPQYMLDNIHPNAKGARQSANFIWSKMKQYYPKYQ